MRAIKQKKDGSNLITGSRDKCKIPSRVLYNSMKFFKRGTIHRGGYYGLRYTVLLLMSTFLKKKKIEKFKREI